MTGFSCKVDSGIPFNSLAMTQEQQDFLNAKVRKYLVEFSRNQPDVTSMFPDPDSATIAQWIDSKPIQNPISNELQLNALFSTLKIAYETGIETSAGTQLSHIPGNGLPGAAIGRYLAAATNRWTGASFSCPGAVALEQSVINWMTDLFGFDQNAGGVLLSGGSMANFTAIIAARSQLGEHFSDGTVYIANNAHHSITKACRLAGIACNQIRVIPTNDNYKCNVPMLEQSIRNDIRAGMRPMMIAATAGTTNTGSIDPLQACAELSQRYNTWFHVDAAYGGFFALTQRGKERLKGINEADSITVDAHKSLFMPFGIGALLAADRHKLSQPNCESGHYLSDMKPESELPDFCELGPELTRPNRGLEMWLPLQLHGTDAFASQLDRMLDLADYAKNELENIEGIEVLNTPELSVVCFSCIEGDRATESLLNFINESRQLHVSSTVLNESLVIRLAFLNYKTQSNIVTRLISLIREYLMKTTHTSALRGPHIKRRRLQKAANTPKINVAADWGTARTELNYQ